MDSLTRTSLFRNDNLANLALTRSLNALNEQTLIRYARQYRFQALYPADGNSRCTCKAWCVYPGHPVPGVTTRNEQEMREILMSLPGLQWAFIMRDGSLQPVEFDNDKLPPLAPTQQELAFPHRY